MNSRKRHVLLTAQRLFTEKGFVATSVQDIIDESKISKGTFYNYFSSKNECIVAIIENAKEETDLKRRELLIQQDSSSKEVLIKQLSVRMEINKERNLVPILVAIFHSQDSDLKEVVKKNHYEEVRWLANRLVEVFGDETKEVSVDCALLMLGMIQQMHHPWTIKSKDVSVPELIEYVMRRIEPIIYEIAKTNDNIIDTYTFNHYYDETHVSKKHVIGQLESYFQAHRSKLKVNEQQIIEFLIEELKSEKPRKFLLETIIHSLSKTFKDYERDPEVKEIAVNVWQTIDDMP